MKRTTFSLQFFIKRTRLLKTGLTPIYLRLTVNGERSETSLKYSIEPDLWDPKKGCSRSKSKEGIRTNEYLQEIKSRIFNIRQEMENKGEYVTSASIKERYLGTDIELKNIIELYSKHNDKLKELIGKGVAYGTYERHTTSRKHIKSFIKYKYNVNDFPARRINKRFIEDYYHFLLTQKAIAHNTAKKYIDNFGKILRIAFEDGLIPSNPNTRVNFKIKPVETIFLTKEELDSILKKEIKNERLAVVRDVFVFCCLTGLAFIDVKTLKEEHKVTNNGDVWILKPRQKSHITSRIPLLPMAQKIIDKYSANNSSTGFLLPVKSNQKMNNYLKELADICNINKNLSTHVARHTFATTVTLSNNVSMESVSKMLGHTSLTMTQKYARILDHKINNEMQGNVAAKY